MDARHLARALAEPSYVATLDARGWTALLAMAHAERLTASLAWRLDGLAMPDTARDVLDQARAAAEVQRTQALWEAEMARRVLAPLGPVILLKGTAYAAAGLDAGRGRLIGDLDILVPRDRVDEAENALRAAGWEWVKPDAYDDAYYRRHMHELPPLIHRERDRMIDVHHTILPLTARTGRPDAAALIARAVPIGGGLHMLAPEDMLLHSVAHLFADGDLAGGLRNLWDIDRLIREFSDRPNWWDRVRSASAQHSLTPHLSRALRLARHLFDTPVDDHLAWRAGPSDVWYLQRILACNGWGQQTRKSLRFAFFIRSHWIRMPTLMLARHLFVKWRRARAA